MHTHATSRIGETSPQNCQKTKESLENIKIFLLLKPNFPHTKFNFLQWFSAFFNGFPLSSSAFWFSSTAFQFSSMAFNFPRNPRKSIYGEKYTKDHYLSFVFFATRSPICSPSFVIPATIPIISYLAPTLVIKAGIPQCQQMAQDTLISKPHLSMWALAFPEDSVLVSGNQSLFAARQVRQGTACKNQDFTISKISTGSPTKDPTSPAQVNLQACYS